MSDETTVLPSEGSGDPHREDARRMQRVLNAYYGPRFRVDRVIGRGGMSTVWLAAEGESRDVAVKVLKPELTDDAEFRARFRAEAEAAETIHSPHVVETFDYGEVPDVDGTGVTYCFIVMEYIQGESLADILVRERTLPEVMALDLVTQAAMGLQAIHAQGLVHRDIKPGNLLITADGVVKVTDFGIAKAASAVPLTRTGMVVGTAQYVSPEQAQGLDVGPPSDIYSLGVVGYEILAGHRPFSGESTVSVALKHISTPAPEIPGDISGPIRELITICLRKDPQARYADGGELASAAVRVRAGEMPPPPAGLAARGALSPSTAPPTSVGAAVTDTHLGGVTDRSNMGPAPRGSRHAGQRDGGTGWIWAVVIAALVAGGILLWAVASGTSIFGGGSSTRPTETTTITNQVPVYPPDNGDLLPERTVTPPVRPSETPTETPSSEVSPTSTPGTDVVAPTTSEGVGGGSGGTTTSPDPGGGTGGGETHGALPQEPMSEATTATDMKTAAITV